MKRFISLAAVALAAMLCFCACGKASGKTPAPETSANEASTTEDSSNEASTTEDSSNDTPTTEASAPKIVCTIFPEYDWVREILGEKAEGADLTMLLDNGVDLHSYQPTAEDIVKISECDLFIYVGGESDGWVDDALKEKTNKDMVVINLLDTLGDNVKEEEVVEGMEAEEEEEEEGEEEEGPEYDEHVWLSLKNTKILVAAIADALEKIDSENADIYKKNAEEYTAKLDALDVEYADTVKNAALDTVLFGDRFPFRYMVDDYGLKYYAAFVGCSAETEASFETIAFLAGKVDELGLKNVLTIEGQNHKIAETIIQNTSTKDQGVLTMDSMQSTTTEDVQGGATYLGIMESNLEVLKEALN
ncbi:metal ABC transporter substrate-binding protein [Butyrivibrio sp. XPD2002]|uniref:metal ABC transporter substrate-binding protein n=1 Tax=Butyrivibrio sp. XPD2002 TaxID=1280665 RepID=UPI00041C5986|nr:metal ABC transporter substrate-binding protein [Butyrivibrio sp. XPD2002]